MLTGCGCLPAWPHCRWRTPIVLKRPGLNTLESIHQKGAPQERSSGHIMAFSEEDTCFTGRKKSIHNLLTEGFSACMCAHLPISAISLLLGCVYHDAALSNGLLCIQPLHTQTHISVTALTLSDSWMLN